MNGLGNYAANTVALCTFVTQPRAPCPYLRLDEYNALLPWDQKYYLTGQAKVSEKTTEQGPPLQHNAAVVGFEACLGLISYHSQPFLRQSSGVLA